MLETNVQRWVDQLLEQGKVMGIKQGKDEWLQKGVQKGKAVGKREGVQKGQTALLARMIRKRFGSVPAWAAEKLEQATTAQLEQYAERLLDAETVEAIFG